MPKLLIFVPCEKLIVSSTDSSISLISVFTDSSGVYTTKKAPPTPLIVPQRWTIFSLWRKLPEDESKRYRQIVRMIGPSGNKVMESEAEFTLTKSNHRVITNMTQLPVLPNGTWRLELYLTESGAPVPEIPLATYDIGVSTQVEIEGEFSPSETNEP